ncbi:hypothetical protein Tcan_10472 [Toxocara canis]|uniref:Uncharacterized protein n=1 Tax=Toxocara canis TaxID=6265 RepID=A0A0B2V6K1_TOXCA|nr:hypothetical protein Tcan_10472 [Toxocara canis]
MQRPKPNSTDFIYGDVDEYGHPYKLKRWKIPVSNLCEPHFIHSTERVADEDSLSSSRQATISGVLYSPYNAHLFASIGLSFALMLWDI